VEPTPIDPSDVNVVVAVPPNSAKLAERFVEDADALNFCKLVNVFATDVSNVSAPDVTFNPVPSRLLKDEPFRMRLVVEAVVNEA